MVHSTLTRLITLASTLWVALSSIAHAQTQGPVPMRETQWWARGSLVFFVLILAVLLFLTAKTSQINRPRRP